MVKTASLTWPGLLGYVLDGGLMLYCKGRDAFTKTRLTPVLVAQQLVIESYQGGDRRAMSTIDEIIR
ncbi:hypothetical protein D3C77_753520 [compost metagenome]